MNTKIQLQKESDPNCCEAGSICCVNDWGCC
jgi:hypothetical protein